MARHRTGGRRHRARHPEDRQGGRRPPALARASRAPTGSACSPPSATGGRASALPPRRRLPRGPRRAGQPGSAGRWPADPAFGKEMIAGQWANAEFERTVPVVVSWECPCRTRCRSSAPRSSRSSSAPPTASPRPGWPPAYRRTSPDLWEQLVEAMVGSGPRRAWPTGTCRAYNILVHDGRLVIIDLPQIVDVVAHPGGAEFLGPRRPQRRHLVRRTRRDLGRRATH